MNDFFTMGSDPIVFPWKPTSVLRNVEYVRLFYV